MGDFRKKTLRLSILQMKSNPFFLKNLRNGKMFVFLQCQIVVRGREQFALAAIFKLDLSDPHMRT